MQQIVNVMDDLSKELEALKTQTQFNSSNLDNLQYQIESQLQITSNLSSLESKLAQSSKNFDQFVQELKDKESQRHLVESKQDEILSKKFSELQNQISNQCKRDTILSQDKLQAKLETSVVQKL